MDLPTNRAEPMNLTGTLFFAASWATLRVVLKREGVGAPGRTALVLALVLVPVAFYFFRTPPGQDR